MLPFNATIPDGVEAYTINNDLTLVKMRSVPAHQPVLVTGYGEATFTGSGDVSFATSALDDQLRGTYTDFPLYAGDYVLARNDGQWGLKRLTTDAVLHPFDVYAQPSQNADFIPFDLSATGIVSVQQDAYAKSQPTFSLTGQRVSRAHHGILVRAGRKYVNR
jgi:hypothetical protein